MSVTEYLHDLKASPYRELPFTWENVKCVASPDEVPRKFEIYNLGEQMNTI